MQLGAQIVPSYHSDAIYSVTLSRADQLPKCYCILQQKYVAM